MNIHVLQGLNLKYPVTAVIAELEAVKPDLLDFFKELHPIFMEDYEITSGKTLEVQTHLPNLWKNEDFLRPIEEFSTDRTTFEESKDSMLEIVRLLISSMSTIPILQAAHEMGHETFQFYTNSGIISEPLMNRYYNIGIGKETTVTVSAGSVGDSVLAFKTQRDKWYTNQFIEAMDFPIAPWRHVDSKADLSKIAKDLGFPLVIKPVGLTGGHAVFVGIESLQELEDAYDKIRRHMTEKPHLSSWQGEIIVQRKIPGDDYRVLVVGGTFEIATHRIPAQVKGDGEHTLRDLIELENENPARNTSLPTHTLKCITIDEELEEVVKKNGHTLDDIPNNNEVVYVRRVASMSQGGITADVTDKVHPQIKAICESIGASIHANVLGVDVLCKDISKPLTSENGGIIEMNTMPEIYLNAFPVIGKQYPDIGKKILGALINPNIHTNRIVILGKLPRKDILQIIRKETVEKGKIGLLHDNTMYIDDHEINSGISIESAVLSLKKNKSLDTIALHFSTVEEIEENGFGFNEIDLMIADKETLAPIKETIEPYIKNGTITKLITV